MDSVIDFLAGPDEDILGRPGALEGSPGALVPLVAGDSRLPAIAGFAAVRHALQWLVTRKEVRQAGLLACLFPASPM